VLRGNRDSVNKYGFEHIDDDDPLYLAYAGLDAICTAQLIDLMFPVIQQRGQWEALWADLKLQWAYDLLQYRGLAVDGPYVRWLSDQLKYQVEINSALLAHYYIGPSGTGPAIGRAFEWLGVESPKKTKTGKACWDKTVLPEIAEAAPDSYAGILATAIMAVRKAGKYWSSYVKPMLERLEIDGKLHPDLRAIGTISSRNSAMRPPLQQLPKKDKRVRAAICAPFPDWVFVTADLQQGEPRVMCAMSGDQNLKKDLLHGDLYSEIAKLTYGDRYLGVEEGKKPGTGSYILRQKAKFAFLAWTYGCAPKKLASLLSVTANDSRKTGAEIYLMPTQASQDAIKRWERRYPKLVTYRDKLNQQQAITLESGWVVPLWDRYYVDEEGVHCGSKPSRLGLNCSTQGNQAHVFRVALHRLIDWGYSWALYFVMHDEAILCGPRERATELAAVLKKAMTMDFHGVPIECDVDPPEDWGWTWMPQPQEYLDTFEAAHLADLDADASGSMHDLVSNHAGDLVEESIARVLVA
jgi:DNA polymerase I-like protein with 3'-5' exonuclease and polymerase domains